MQRAHKGWIFALRAKEKPTNSERILGIRNPGDVAPHHLFSGAQTRALKHAASGTLPHTLMQRAGLAIAQFALAVAPHARVIWIACGPGNNGGDGYEAAIHLQLWGKKPVITCWDQADRLPPDAARQRAQEVGVTWMQHPINTNCA